MVFYFHKEKNSTNRKKYVIFGDGAPVFKSFPGIRNGNFNLEDWQHSGRLSVVVDDQIKILIKDNMGYNQYIPPLHTWKHLDMWITHNLIELI